MAVTPFPLSAAVIPVAGQPVTAVFGPVLGGFIVNPATPEDQNLAEVEAIFVDVVGDAALFETVTTYVIQPGQTFFIPTGLSSNVSINAASAGHRFGGVIWQPAIPFPPTPQPGPFPPAGPTTLTATIPSYLYQQYADDDALQAFVAAYNELAQVFTTWFATGLLPDYTSDTITGPLLDWVAEGLYGMKRPALSSGQNRDIGPLNTYAFNALPLNRRRIVGPNNVTVTSDDVFKRIMTWNLYVGDGKVFSIPWLKRRIMRFLIGENGSAPNIDNTDAISVSVGAGVISIRISAGTRSIIGGALPNRFGLNSQTLNGLRTLFTPGANPFPFESVLKEAMDAGALNLPFQYRFIIIT